MSVCQAVTFLAMINVVEKEGFSSNFHLCKRMEVLFLLFHTYLECETFIEEDRCTGDNLQRHPYSSSGDEAEEVTHARKAFCYWTTPQLQGTSESFVSVPHLYLFLRVLVDSEKSCPSSEHCKWMTKPKTNGRQNLPPHCRPKDQAIPLSLRQSRWRNPVWSCLVQ